MIAVREATKEDIEIIYDLILAIAQHHDQKKCVVTTKNELEKSGFGLQPEFGVLLAEIDGEIAGYVSYIWNYSIWLGSKYMNIDDVFVWQKYRGQKVGEVLMVKAREVCKSHGFNKLRWEVQQDNHRAIKFYKSLGAEIDIKGVCHWSIE